MSYRYVKVPFRLIPLVYKTDGLEKLVLYSIYSEALELPFERENVTKRILYIWLHGGTEKFSLLIPKRITNALHDLEDEVPYIGLNETEYRGFIRDEQGKPIFNPTDEKGNSVIKRLDTKFDEDNSLWQQATMYYRIYSMLMLLEVSCNFSFERYEEVFKELCVTKCGYNTTDWNEGHAGFNLVKAIDLLKREATFKTDYPLSKRNCKLAIEEYRQIEEKKVVLAADMAMRSIKGRKAIGKATKKEILARMIGRRNLSDKVDINDPDIDLECKAVYRRYSDKDYFLRLIGLMRGSFFDKIESVKGSGYFFSNSRDMKDNEMEDGMFKIMATNKTAKAKYRKRRQRAKSKNCTFKQKGLTPQKHEGDVTMQPQKPQQQFNVPIDAPFLPFGDYPQPTGNVPQKYQQQPAIQQPMQQQMPFPTMQGYQTVQQQPPQMEEPPFPPFAK